jgi:hypothetical protein
MAQAYLGGTELNKLYLGTTQINDVETGKYNDPDAQAFIDATGITGTDATAINTLVVDLKADNLWTKMKVIYPMIGGTVDTCKYNLVNPQDTDAAYRITFTGSNTFDANGVTFGGNTSSYGDTHINLSASADFNQNSGHLSFYNRQVPTGEGYMGYRDFDNPTSVTNISVTAGSSSFGGWCSPVEGKGTISTVVGQMLISRTNSTTEVTYINGASELTYAGTSRAKENLPMFIGAIKQTTGVGATIDSTCAFVSVGDGLDGTEVANFYTIVQAYQTTLGRQV